MANTKTQTPRVTLAERRYRKLLEGRDRSEYEALAAAKGVAAKTLVWWRWEIERRDRSRGAHGGARAKRGTLPSKEESVPFLPVRVAAPSKAVLDGADHWLEVRLRSGHEVAVPRSFDAEDLRRLVAVLEGMPC
jgi:hypothetical protein